MKHFFRNKTLKQVITASKNTIKSQLKKSFKNKITCLWSCLNHFLIHEFLGNFL